MSGAAETREAIVEATFAALVEHGSDLTIQTIADEFEKTKGLLCYYYDTEEDLLVDFLRWMTDGFVTEVEPDTDVDPVGRPDAIPDLLVPWSLDGEELAIRTATLELRIQTPYHDAYAEWFVALDTQLDAGVGAVLAEGVETGQFDVDPAAGASPLTSAVDGELLRVVTGDADPAEARAATDTLVERFRA